MNIGKYNISSYVDDLIPDHIQATYPDLVNFLKVYALYLERQNKSGFYLNSIDTQRDIDFVEEVLLTELQNEIGVPVPRDFAADPRMFYKRLVEFYRSRGTEESITSFFRIIFDDEVELYFPFTDLLNPSDGDWTDKQAAIIANQENYTPWNIFKISGTPTEVSGNNSVDNPAYFDDDVVFVNDVYQTPGTDYREIVYSESNTTKYKLVFTNALVNEDVVKTYPKGMYSTTSGFVSQKEKRIQDSNYYQKFSYVCKTGANVEQWKNAFTRLIHPSGFKFFGEILLFLWNKEEHKLLTNAQWGWLPPAGFITLNLAKYQYGPPVKNAIGTHSVVLDSAGILSSSTDNYSLVEKTYAMPSPTGSGGTIGGKWDIGMWDHWDNIKFKYNGPISNFTSYSFINNIYFTVADGINNNIGIQFGYEVMKLTCDTVNLYEGEPYTSTVDKPYIVSGVHQTTTAGSFVEGDFYKIATINDGIGGADTDFTLVGSANNTVGTIFKATGVGAGTGTTTRYTRYYLQDCTLTNEPN